MFTIRFCFENGDPVEASAQEGDNLLEIARRHNVAIDAPCSGNASCGKCRVQLLKGQLKSERTRHITRAEYGAGWRLMRRRRCFGAGYCFCLPLPHEDRGSRKRRRSGDL